MVVLTLYIHLGWGGGGRISKVQKYCPYTETDSQVQGEFAF